MKKSTASNRKTGRMIAKNLIILVVLVFVAILAMWAWITDKSSATADDLSVSCKFPDGIEIAIVPHSDKVSEPMVPKDKDYREGTITLNANDYKFIKDLSLTEITSDGIDFVKPMLSQKDGVAEPDTSVDWETATPNERYLSFDLYIRSKGTPTVYLNTGSKFTTVSDVLVGENAGNKSTDTNISRDAIVGATRFSIYEDITNEGVTTSTRRILWIPRPDLYFSSLGGASLAENVTKDKYDGESYKHTYWTPQKVKTVMKDKNVTTSEAVTNSDGKTEYVLNKKTEITSLTTPQSFESGNYYVSKVVCNMWIEGEDTEARLALVKGKFNIDLNLTIK